MNILTHAVHTGYQFDLGKTGHEFYSLEIPGSHEVFWDARSRPQPVNYHRLKFTEELDVKMDLALVHFDFGYHCLKHWSLPLIFKEHCLRDPFVVPSDWIDRIAHYSFASRSAASRWKLPAEIGHRVSVIGMGMDSRTYGGYNGLEGDVLVVGQNILSRGNEKGYDNVMRLSQKFHITVVGKGNEGIPGAIGSASNYNELLRHYQSHRVFLNPSRLLDMSTLEAMATGMPVVCFRMVNSDVIRDGIDGFVVDSVEEAESALNNLLKNPLLAQRIGSQGRALANERFRMDLFIQRWNTLFQKAVDEHPSTPKNENGRPFDIYLQTVEERRLAESMTRTSFEYCRVGFDRRTMTFQPNGRVGEGAGGYELFWNTKIEDDRCFLEILSGDSLTCRLEKDGDGKWKGVWTKFEKMPIVLSPIPIRRKARWKNQ